MTSYRFCQLLGHGGMGEVYLAVQEGFGGFEKLIVVKRMSPFSRRDEQLTELFSKEARLAACIRHPNVVEVLDIKKTERELFIMMEYISGLSMRDLLNRASGPIPMAVICRTLADVAAGLHAGHHAIVRGETRKIVHGDVSPANLMVGFDGTSKVLDFGIARVVRSEEVSDSSALGKLAYVAPEQLQSGPAGPWTDVWQLGIVAHELITRSHPFAVEGHQQMLKAIVSAEIPPLCARREDAPEALDALVRRMLDRDPKQRPNGQETRQALLEILTKLDSDLDGGVAEWLETEFPEELAMRTELAQRASGGSLDTRDLDYLSDLLRPEGDAESVSLEPAPAAFDVRRPRNAATLVAVLLVLLMASGLVIARNNQPADEPRPRLNPAARNQSAGAGSPEGSAQTAQSGSTEEESRAKPEKSAPPPAPQRPRAAEKAPGPRAPAAGKAPAAAERPRDTDASPPAEPAVDKDPPSPAGLQLPKTDNIDPWAD